MSNIIKHVSKVIKITFSVVDIISFCKHTTKTCRDLHCKNLDNNDTLRFI